MPRRAWPVSDKVAMGQQIAPSLSYISQLYRTCALALSELAAATELLPPLICTQHIEVLLQSLLVVYIFFFFLLWPIWQQSPANVSALHQTARQTYVTVYALRNPVNCNVRHPLK